MKNQVYKRVCNPWNETVANGTNTTVITHSNCTRKLDHNETRYKTSWKEHPQSRTFLEGVRSWSGCAAMWRLGNGERVGLLDLPRR